MARTRVRAGDAEILREAKARWERCHTWYATATANAKADSKFSAGDQYNNWQWDQTVQKARGDRPCLTHNKVRQHNLQIINDARQHKAQIKVTPTGGRATYEAAQIFSGIIRRIEYQSKAIDAYSTAFFHQVDAGYGVIGVETDFADEESFDQEIYVRRKNKPRTIYFDPDARDYDKADGRFAFEFNDTPRDLYEAENGKSDSPINTFDNTDDWSDKDHVREAKYWRRSNDNDTLHLMTDGSTIRESDMADGELEARKPDIVKSREISAPEVECFHIVGNRIDKRQAWLGKYIPLVPVIGEETVIDNVMDLKGHTRALIGAQQMYNYWSSQAVEQVALQTKSPWTASTRATEGHTNQWDSANTASWSVLYYNDIDDNGQPIERPTRVDPPVMAQAFLQGMNIAREDMMMVSGQYQAEMGQPSNERSGVAIQQRQRQGDNATYHFVDNQAKAIRQVGRILLDLIPKIYDVARVTKIMAEDGSDSDVHIVPNAPDAHQHVVMTPNGPQPVTPQQADAIDADPDQPNAQVIFNPTVGSYDVEADVGPPFGTQRQEAANAFSQIMQQNPAAFQVVGDFWAQNSDFPGADELAERLRRGLPPQYKAGAPDPAVQQLQQAMQQSQAQAHELLGKADGEIAALKQQLQTAQLAAKDKGAGNEIADYQAETERLKAVAAADPVAAQVIIRSLLSGMLGMPALPVMQEHSAADAEHAQAIAPPEPAGANGAGNGAEAGP
ncbi:MAG TPA: portal protein [Acetobacteraceae bacterium]|nr:portal protein [Acetobacteraceae bacterium]